MAQMHNKLNNTNKNGGNSNITSGRNKSNKVPFLRQFYCLTHGVCNHQGSYFHSKAKRHKENVTINKQLNGSNLNYHHRYKNNHT